MLCAAAELPFTYLLPSLKKQERGIINNPTSTNKTSMAVFIIVKVPPQCRLFSRDLLEYLICVKQVNPVDYFILFYFFKQSISFIIVLKRFLHIFNHNRKISFEQVQIQLIILALSTLQIRRNEFSEELNIVICVSIDSLAFYVFNMDDVRFFQIHPFCF